MSSRLPEFYELSVDERLEIIKKFAKLTNDEIGLLKSSTKLGIDVADKMVENVIGTTELPFGIAVNFLINGKDYLIPMVIEEPSVIAAASHAAKLARNCGGFQAEADSPIMRGQIQIINPTKNAEDKIMQKKDEILALANSDGSTIIRLGGGAKGIEMKRIKAKKEMLILYLLVDVRDAMGANTVNTMLERIAPFVEKITGGKANFRIISNLADLRLARAKAEWSKKDIGKDVIEGIINGYELAVADPYRAATHNKGIMNGIDAVALATGQDWRALEAGAHAWAARKGYGPLTRYYKNKNGNLVGEIELPIAVGIVGGSIKSNPIAQIALKILGVSSAQDLAAVMAAVGLAQNFAAMRALAAEGIQKGHMRLHARNIAMAAGIKGRLVDVIADRMADEGNISIARAKELIKEYGN
ncbi:MAG: hydroxymethylglutaryl-CoA reductase, degradative [Candidatus Aenigmatarchaeota archaeon]